MKTPRTNEELVAAHRAGDRTALNELVKQNQGLIGQQAASLNKFADWDDLLQEGSLGFLVAVERFDSSRNTRLTTYASWWIRAYQLQLVFRDRMIPFTNKPQKRIFRMADRVRAKLKAAGLESDARAIARALGMKERTVARVLPQLNAPLSGDAFVRNQNTPNSKVTLFDTIPDLTPHAADALEQTDTLERRRAFIRRFRRGLEGRDRLIFDGRLLGERTLVDIGTELGISLERVRQLEGRILDDMRREAHRMIAAEEAEAA